MVVGETGDVVNSCRSCDGDRAVEVYSSVEIRPRQRNCIKPYWRDDVCSRRQVLSTQRQSHQGQKSCEQELENKPQGLISFMLGLVLLRPLDSQNRPIPATEQLIVPGYN